MEDGASPTIDYIKNVIDELLQAPMVHRAIELDAGSGARPLDTEREILASMLGQRSTGKEISENDLPGGLKPRLGIEIPAELEGDSLGQIPEMGDSSPRKSGDVESEAYCTAEFRTSPPSAFQPLEAKQTPEGQIALSGTLIRHDSSFSPPDTGMVSILLGRPLPSIPESAVRAEPINPGTTARQTTSLEISNMPLPTPQTSTDLDSESFIHPAFRNRRNNAPLRLFRGASAFLDAEQCNEIRRQGVARASPSHDVQLAPSTLERPQQNHLKPTLRHHHYSKSTSDLASRNASDFTSRQTSHMHGIDLSDQPRPDSNALGIYMANSLTNPIDPNISPPEPLQRSRHSVQISRSIGFEDLRAAQSSAFVAQNEVPIAGHSSGINRSNSTQDRRLTHNEGVSQFNRENHPIPGPSRASPFPPVRPALPFSHSADQGPAYLLPPEPDDSILHPYPAPWQAYPAPPHAYPRPPMTQAEEIDAASTRAEADSMNNDAAIAQIYQPSAVARIAAVMGTTAPATATRLLGENLPSVVRARISRDFLDDGERAMRRVSGEVKRVSFL